MNRSEISYLISKKEREGKSATQILLELKDIQTSKIVFKENKKELRELNKKINKLKLENDKLKNKNLNLGLKNLVPSTEYSYHNQRFPNEKEIARVKLCLRSFEHPVTISEIRNLCYGVNMGLIRDCLMILCYSKVVTQKEGNRFSISNELV